MGKFTVKGNWLIDERMVEVVPVELPGKFSPQEQPLIVAAIHYSIWPRDKVVPLLRNKPAGKI